MKYSGIGGQAVMEGVMMKNGDKYAVAVRKPDHEIEIKTEEVKGFLANTKLKKVPFIRGVFVFLDSLITGMSTLMWSASFFEEEEAPKKDDKYADAKEKALMGGTLVFSLVMAICLFMLLPYFLSRVMGRFTDSESIIAICEGVLRLLIFIIYIVLISRMEDIKRVFMYHGAEHKCINCIEHGLPLNVENVRNSSKEHKRCGTSFLVFVVIISIVLFIFIRVDSHALRLIVRLALIPVIAGLSYELLRLAGIKENAITNILSKPGMLVQGLTTKEPDDEMIEVGIASVEAVFDWKAYLTENFGVTFKETLEEVENP